MRETHPGNALSSDEDSDDSAGSPQVSPATRAAAHASFEGFDVSWFVVLFTPHLKLTLSVVMLILPGGIPCWPGL
jgi:hypothetical protein